MSSFNFEYYFSLLGGSGIILAFFTKLFNLIFPDNLPSIRIYKNIPNKYENLPVETFKCCYEEEIPYKSETSRFTYYSIDNRLSYNNVSITHDNKYKVTLKPNTKIFFYNDIFFTNNKNTKYNVKYKLNKNISSNILLKHWKGGRSDWSNEHLLNTTKVYKELSQRNKDSQYSATLYSKLQQRFINEDIITKEQFGISFINTTNEILEFIIEEIFYEELNIYTKSTKKIKLFNYYIYLHY